MQAWYLIAHDRHALGRIEPKIKGLGVEIYSPLLKVMRARQDWDGVRSVEKQLFPGYLFLHFDPEQVHTTKVSDIPGVKGFIRFGGKISTVSDCLIEALKQSLQIRADRTVSNFEFRNISPQMIEKLTAIVHIKSKLQRQSEFLRLLQNESKRMGDNSAYSVICSDIAERLD